MSRIYRATFECHHSNGTIARPSLHYQTDVPLAGSEPDASDVANGIWTLLGTEFRAICPTSVTVDAISVAEEVIAPDIGAAGSHTVALAGTMTVSGDPMPEGLVPVLNLHTDVRSRSARGWLHPPGPMGSSRVSGDSWTSVYLGVLNAFCAKLDDGFDLGTLQITRVNPKVYSRTRRERAEDPFVFSVKSATVNPRPHWLRTRMTTP